MHAMTDTQEQTAVIGPETRLFPHPAHMVLFLLLIASSVVPAGGLTVAMLGVVALLLVDPYAGEKRIVMPGAGYFGLIMLAGLSGAAANLPYDVAKDIWYVGNALLTLWCGYLIIGRIGEIVPVLRTVALAALFQSLMHLGWFLAHPSSLSKPLADIRMEAGAGHLLSALGAALVLGDRRFRLGIFRSAWSSRICLAACGASIVMSFSRSLWIAFLTLLAVAVLNIRFKTALRAAALAVVVALVLFALSGGGGEKRGDAAEHQSFPDKVLFSVQELRLFEYDSEEDINRYWRGFESFRALQEYASGGPAAYLLGKGFGTNVELGFTMTLAGEQFDRIPILHNGYLYLLVKTGAIGLLSYLLYLVLAFRLGARLAAASKGTARFCGYMLAGLAVVMAESTLVISGMFNKNWLYPATLLMGILAGYTETILREGRGSAHASRA